MKRLFYLMLLLPILFVGCKKNDVQNEEPEAVKLSVDPNSIISPSAGADYTLTLTAPEAWTATCADSWVKVTPSSGNAGTVEINVKIAADKESVEATSKIVFKSGGQTVEVPVKRLAKDPARLMIVSGTDIYTPKDGGVYSIKVESNIKWQISSNANWAKIEGNAVVRNNGVISVTVDAATTPEETVATLTISPLEGSGVEKQTVTITRSASDATYMTVNKSQIDAPADGGSYSITVSTTAQWKATKSWDADWITLSNNEKTGNGSFSIKVDPATSGNDAKTVITVEEVRSDDYKPVQLNVLVTRKGKANAELSVEPTSISSPAEGGDFTVTIKSNYAWAASLSSSEYFSISANKGDGDATMVVTVKPATDAKEVTGTIIIKSTYGDAKQTISLRRLGTGFAGKDTYFSVSDTKKVYFSKGNLQYYKVPNSHTWRFAPEQFQVCGRNNEIISDGWIDLFGYGTSGATYGTTPLLPSTTSTVLSDYYPYAIEGTNYDWGVDLTKNNELPLDATTSGVQGTGKWRTLTTAEWRYLLFHRPLNSAAFANIQIRDGLILLPDDYQPTEVTLNYLEYSSDYTERMGKCSANKLTLNEWRILEKAGAVFLPFTGYRYGLEMQHGERSYYWTSTIKVLNSDEAETIEFYPGNDGYDLILPPGRSLRSWGCAVRLVQDVE